MITKFEQFIKEKFDYKEYKPLEGTFGTTIAKKNIEANVGELVKFAKKYKIEEIELDKLYHKGLWKGDDWKKNGVVKPEGVDKWVKYKDLTDKQKEEFEEEVSTTIDKANLKYPIIVSKGKRGKLTILDGNHRVEKAYKLKKDTIKAHVIPEADVVKEFGKTLNEDNKEEREKLLDKEEKKYLKKTEIKKLTDKQRRTLLAKRKYHGAMNDADLVDNEINNHLATLKESITVYRGEPEGIKKDINKTSIWVTPDRQFAEQYGKVKSYKLSYSNLNLIDVEYDYTIWERLIDKFKQLTGNVGDYEEYKYEPPKEFIDFLQSKGYDGFENNENMLIFDKSVLT